MDLLLDAEEVRVLGALLEKETTTPEYYPLSLNALLNACNQKSNRDPVVHFDEETVSSALERLRNHGLVLSITGAGSRVVKFGHRLAEKLNLGRRESAILSELLLRGPQTVGELRSRAERMHRFDDLAEVEAVLEHMPELFCQLPRRPGEKESRYAHLLSGAPAATEPSAQEPASNLPPRPDRLAALEAEVARLSSDLEELKLRWAEFQKQWQ